MDQQSQFPKPNPALAPLSILVGRWDFAGSHPMLPAPVRGSASFEWVQDGAFLSWRTVFERPGPPNGLVVIGRDDSADTYSMLYYDERGVSRIYMMSLENGVWRFWRNSPGFSQRMTGVLSADGNTITAHGEKSTDGSIWDQDLDLIYTKAR